LPLLILLMALALKQDDFKKNTILFSLFILPYSMYLLFVWNGYGRLVIFGWFFVAFFLYAQSIAIKINKYIFALTPGLASVLVKERNLLKLQFHGFESALYDSAFGPYRKASAFINEFHERGFDFSGFFDQ